MQDMRLGRTKEAVCASCNICGLEDYRDICDIEISPIFMHSRLVRCNGCGLFYANPMPKREAEEGYYKDRYLEDQAPGYWYEGRIDIFRQALREMKAVMDKGVLIDVGCGMGFFMGLAKKDGWEVKGVEISNYGVDHATRRLGLDVIKGSLKDAAFVRNYFNAATMWNVLDQLYDPRDNLVELNRILKKGGYLFIRVLNMDFHLNALRFFSRVRWPFNLDGRSPVVFHLYSFDRHSIVKLLEKTGFRAITIRPARMDVNVPDFVRIFGRTMEPFARGSVNALAALLYILSVKRMIASPSLFIAARKI